MSRNTNLFGVGIPAFFFTLLMIFWWIPRIDELFRIGFFRKGGMTRNRNIVKTIRDFVNLIEQEITKFTVLPNE